MSREEQNQPQNEGNKEEKEAKPKRRTLWNLFAPAPQPTEAEKKLLRLEELRRDLFAVPSERQRAGKSPAPQTDYALNTLLNMLRIETATARLAVACALSDSPPQLGKAEAPAFAVQLCIRLETSPHDPLAVPILVTPPSTQTGTSHAWAEEIVVAILTDTLTTLKQYLNQERPPDDEIVYRETDTCRDALRLGARLKAPALVEPAIRLLRLFTPDIARHPGALGRQTPELRSLAGLLLASLPPDDLYPLWVALGGPNAEARRDLIPVLDDLQDPRAIPYLSRLLERHPQWPDGNLLGWAVVRTFQRMGDNRALPVLRRLVWEASVWEANPRPNTSALTSHLPQASPELVRAARNAIEAIEHKRPSADRNYLLRPSQPQNQDLLHPLNEHPDTTTDPAELLRSQE